MGESNNPADDTPLRPTGAIHVTAGAHVPDLRFGAIQPPAECLHWQELDCTGADGQPDELGNDVFGDCVEVSIARLAQLQCPYARKPRAEQDVFPLFRRWTGREPDTLGTQTGPAFDDLARHGWGREWMGYPDPDPWTPRRFVVMREGQAPDMARIKLAISAFRGIQCSIMLPRGGFDWGRGFFIPDTDETEGGHSIALMGYTADGTLKAYTWGGIYDMPLPFFLKYTIECNAFPSQWLTPERLAAHGLSWDALMTVASAVSA